LDLLGDAGRWAISGGIGAKAAAHFRRTAGLPGECKVSWLLRVHVKFLGYLSSLEVALGQSSRGKFQSALRTYRRNS
jgi:hypothetical protein